jgi:O-antigen/teichoic acid export membrane protein
VYIGGEGAIRLLICIVLAIIGVKHAGAYGLALGAAPLLAVAISLRGQRDIVSDGPDAPWSELSSALGALLAGSVLAMALVNGPVLLMRHYATEAQDESISRFLAGLVIARIPLFLFQAVQAALLPRLSRLAARNEIAEFRAGFAKLMKLVLVVGFVGTAGAFLLGPLVIERFYNATLSRNTMAMLALGSAFYMVALAIAQAVIALRGHALVAAGWGVGAATFVLVTWLGSDELFRRVELGLVASSFASLCAFALALRAKLRSGQVPSGESVMDAINNMPLET